MSSIVDRDAIITAYQDVRDDKTDTTWAVFKYDDKSINLESSGSDYEDFKELFSDDERAFGFVRLTTGDELSKRVKFVLVTWMGANVSAMKRAKMSTDKAQVKALIQVVSISSNIIESLPSSIFSILKANAYFVYLVPSNTTIHVWNLNFAVEIQTSDLDELEYDYVIQELRKAGGANYGTGSRD